MWVLCLAIGCNDGNSDASNESLLAPSFSNTNTTPAYGIDTGPSGATPNDAGTFSPLVPLAQDAGSQNNPAHQHAPDADRLEPPDATEPLVELAQCDEPIGGIEWLNMILESNPNFDADLAAVSLEGVPEQIDISDMIGLFKSMIAYTLDVPLNRIGNSLNKQDVLSKGIMGKVVIASFALGIANGTDIDFRFLRRGLHRFYHCSRKFPMTLRGFRAAIFDYASVTPQDIDSIAKCGTRRLFRNDTDKVYVAETLEDGEVRETEIILGERRQDGNLEFLVYDAGGRLTDRTVFPNTAQTRDVTSAAPFVCTTCHASTDRITDTVRYDVLFPTVGPCAD